MKKILVISLLILSFAFCSCEKMTGEEKKHETEMKAIRRMDELITKNPASHKDMQILIETVNSDVLNMGEYINYENGIVKQSNLTIKFDGLSSHKYSQNLVNLIFMNDGTCRKCYNPYIDQAFYAVLKWSYDMDTMAIKLIDDDLVAQGCKNAETELRLRYYGDDMYILDGLLPTPYYENEDCMYRFIVNMRKRQEDRQWYLDHYVDENAAGSEN